MVSAGGHAPGTRGPNAREQEAGRSPGRARNWRAAPALDAKPLVERGNGVAGVATTIARVASDRGTRVLVVGRRGMSKLRSVVLGSVWSAIVERPSCPVLLSPEEN